MTRPASVSALGSEFDGFLYAPIGEDRNGMPLSVLSALARQDFDPWEEAANLTRLSADAATRKLVCVITALPDGPSARADPGTIAARLLLLLPRRTAFDINSRHPAFAVKAANASSPQRPQNAPGHDSGRSGLNRLNPLNQQPQQPGGVNILLYVLIMVFVLLGQYLHSGGQAAAPVERAPPAASSGSPQPPAPNPAPSP